MSGMQGLMVLHQRTVEADHAARARARAEAMEAAMRAARPSGLLGDSRLADFDDIEGAGLFGTGGLFLGAHDGRFLFFNGDAPLLTYARTGAGKGRDVILTNAAHVRDRSMIFIDVKDGENHYASAEHRSEMLGTPVITLDPYGIRGVASTRINPFQMLVDIAAKGARIDSEAKELAYILCPPSPKAGGDEWARKGAQRYLTVAMEYLAHFDPEQCTPCGVWRLINGSKEQTERAFALMTTCGIEGIERRAAVLEQALDTVPKQFEAYRADAIDALDPFEPGKALAEATSAHEFDFGALKHKPHTVYLVLPSDKIEVAGPWVSLILTYAIETIARTTGGVGTTLMLDEFPQLPAAPSIMKMVRLYRGKGLQPWIISQGRFSMEGRWSREAVKEFEDQAGVLMLKGVVEPEVIKDVELWSGHRTVLMRGVSHNGGTVETAAASHSETRRSVLQSEDILGLGDGKQILRIGGLGRLLVADAVHFDSVNPWKFQIKDVRSLHRGSAK